MDPEKANRPPMEPNLVLDNEGTIVLCGHDWAIPIVNNRLEDVTIEHIRPNLRLRPGENPFLHLSPILELPGDDLFSSALWETARQGWIEEVTQLVREGQIADAPAVKALA
jgi:hypothetical protein